MSEHWNCKDLPNDNLWAIVEYAQNQIEIWTRRQEIALGHLAVRGEVLQEPVEP